MAELNIKEARNIYQQADDLKAYELKAMMLTKFSREELEKSNVTQEEFDNTLIELLGQCTKTVFLDENGDKSNLPTNRIELRNDAGEWMFDICFTGNYKHFLVSSYQVWNIFADKYHFPYEEFERLMKNQMKLRFGLDDTTIYSYANRPIGLI